MAVAAVTPRYPMGVSRSNSQLRRIRDVAGYALLDKCGLHFFCGPKSISVLRMSGGLEIVGRDAVQKLFELLHLVLANGGGRLVVVLVGNQQAGLREDGFFDVNRYADP